MTDRSSVVSASLSVACLQTAAHDRSDFTERWPEILAGMRAAALGGARLIVAPEGTVPGYVLGMEPVEPDLIERARADVARIAGEFGCVIVYGSAHRADDGLQYNAAYVVGPDGPLLGVACKGFLWHFDRRWFAAAPDTEPIDTPVGRLGILICADGRIPTIAHTLARRGAQVLVMPTAWVTSGRDPQQLENIQADLMIRARARENGLALVAANKCGIEAHSVAYCGKSAIVDASGAIVAQAGAFEPAIVRGEVTLESLPLSRARAIGVVRPLEDANVAVRRFALAPARLRTSIDELGVLARQADAHALIAAHSSDAIETLVLDGALRFTDIADVRALTIGMDELSDPAALVDARLAGVALFCVRAAELDEWTLIFARTRAAELRAYVVVVTAERSFACDPDGVVIAGTFDAFELAAFVYDAARTRSGLVAPGTDVFEGLREQARRAQGGTTAR